MRAIPVLFRCGRKLLGRGAISRPMRANSSVLHAPGIYHLSDQNHFNVLLCILLRSIASSKSFSQADALAAFVMPCARIKTDRCISRPAKDHRLCQCFCRPTAFQIQVLCSGQDARNHCGKYGCCNHASHGARISIGCCFGNAKIIRRRGASRPAPILSIEPN